MDIQQRDELLAFMAGHRIMTLRKQHGMSQAYLARGIVSQPTLSLLETGKHSPQPELLRLLGEKLDDSVLLTYAELTEQKNDYIDIPPDEILEALLQYTASWTAFHTNLAVQLSEYYFNLGNREHAEKLVDLAINNKLDSIHYYKACNLKGKFLLYSFDYMEAEQYLLRANHAGNLLDSKLRATVLYNLGYTYFFMDKYDLASTYCAEAVVICQQESKLFWLYAKALGLRGAIYHKVGRLDEAMSSLDDAFVMLEKFNGNLEDKFRVSMSAVDVLESQARYDEAEKYLERLRDLAPDFEGIGDTSLSVYYRILARIQFRKGLYSQAELSVSEAIGHAFNVNDDWSITWSLITVLGIYRDARKRRDAAEQILTIAEEKQLPMQGAIAAEALLELSGDSFPIEAYKAITMYRTALFRTIYLEPVAGLLPKLELKTDDKTSDDANGIESEPGGAESAAANDLGNAKSESGSRNEENQRKETGEV
ncbi:helix-turn-helix transcriptional regulator [Alicyclobacillus sp. SO9]|uniref:helix-turn-helix transcriptional regulator n=1 Tax=Alicyclobacillus sp. SO9 TaxID=2665646 RepID=UPI0018E746AA|nr:helix-turn-helix transcriptional regulator [Alicyclobacillus sp. SO9]QQE79882.1 helix-turn-helix transcriptional regulator [Alicyclobacillus sp. SO9]